MFLRKLDPAPVKLESPHNCPHFLSPSRCPWVAVDDAHVLAVSVLKTAQQEMRYERFSCKPYGRKYLS